MNNNHNVIIIHFHSLDPRFVSLNLVDTITIALYSQLLSVCSKICNPIATLFIFLSIGKKSHFVFSFVHRSRVQFGLMSREQMQKQAHVHVISKNLYDHDGSRKPVQFGVLDHKMVSGSKLCTSAAVPI